MSEDTSISKSLGNLDILADASRSVEPSRSSSRTSAPPSPLPRRRGSARSNATGYSGDLSSHSHGSINPKRGSLLDTRHVIKKSADGSMVKYQGGLKQSKSWYNWQSAFIDSDLTKIFFAG